MPKDSLPHTPALSKSRSLKGLMQTVSSTNVVLMAAATSATQEKQRVKMGATVYVE
jgi:hypothetical protein